jgi:hypothetical protein
MCHPPQAEGLQHKTLGHRPKKFIKKSPENFQAEGLKHQSQGKRFWLNLKNFWHNTQGNYILS